MSLEYSLVLAGDLAPESVLPRLFSGHDTLPDVETSGPVRIVDMFETQGFELRLVPGSDGYFEANDGEGNWIWEPKAYLDAGFRFDKFLRPGIPARNMLHMVAAVLSSGDEDAALIQNGDRLLLRREAGNLTVFRKQGFWNNLAAEDLPDLLKPAKTK